MKLYCGKKWTAKERALLLVTWQPVFAWWPVRVGERECRWLEVVERKLGSGKSGLETTITPEAVNGWTEDYCRWWVPAVREVSTFVYRALLP